MPTITITFDDAPLGDGPLLTAEERTQMLIDALAALGIEATFYVTPEDFSRPGGYERIAAYNDAGHLIAGHTNTHPAASETDPAVFLADIDAATALLSEFSNYRPWFRFPFLDEGNTVELRDTYRAGLDERGLSNGYVTTDTFDWYISDMLANAVATGGYYDLDGIRDAYVKMIVDAAIYYEALSQETLGRSAAQVLLLHENDLAALFITDVIVALQEAGWDVVSSDVAYDDPIADVEPDTLQTGRGQLAAIAIDNGADPSILNHQGNTQQGLDALLNMFNAFETGDSDITGSATDDILIGTVDDDVMIGLDGEDVFVGQGGDDLIFGDVVGQTERGDYDQVNYAGARADYTFVANADGSVSVVKPGGGVDTLYSIEGFWFFGEEAWYGVDDVLAPVPVGGVITGTAGDDYLIGADGDDVISGLAGSDEIEGSAGNDVIDGGGDEYDQVDYAGRAADYVFTRNNDGSVSVAKPGGGTDTLTNIDGFWFSGEAAWYSMDELAPTDPVGNVITGTSGDDYLVGSQSDDVISALLGSDEIVGSAGNDVIDGGGDEYDQVDYDGSLSDYTFSENGDGTVSVAKPGGGVDTLSNIDGFWFGGEAAWYSLSQALIEASGGGVIDGTDGDDLIYGSAGDDVITLGLGSDTVVASGGSDLIIGDDASYDQVDYDGAPSDYVFLRLEDGTILVTKPGGETDTLASIDGFWFGGSQEWVSADDLAPLIA